MSEATEREAICSIGASIFARGLTAGSSGNISVRTDDGWLMTPTNASLGRLDRHGYQSSTMTGGSFRAIRRPKRAFCMA